jgi:hypothetical protein
VFGLIVAMAGLVPADVKAPAPVADRVARARVVVVGKVTGLEPKSRMLTFPHGGDTKVEFAIGVVKVDELILGPKGLTHVKVAFQPAREPRTGRPRADLQMGEEVCLFLTPHPTEPVHFIPMYFDRVAKSAGVEFTRVVETARRQGKLLTNPADGLTSKKAEDRYLTAALLVSRYRTPPVFRAGGAAKTELVSAEESKRILQGLLDGAWETPILRGGDETHPLNLFFKLGLDKRDGWAGVGDFKQLISAARKWLQENADTYRIKRFVEK